MAEFIDISDFGGVVTNVDVEDLPEHIAQNMENLRIRDGKLEKTFGAGQPSDIPTFLLNDLNTKLSSSYVVYNVFTFISDKLGAIEHRYILVLIDSSTKQVKLFWYDPTIVISEHLQIESNILYFTTAEDQGYSQGDNVMITGAKDNSNVDISNTEYVDDITEKSGNKHFINIDQAKTWGGSFFATTAGDGLVTTTFGGKDNTHLSMDTDASVNDSGDGVGSFRNIALLAQSGEVLCMYSYNVGSKGKIQYTIGGTKAELNTTLYNTWEAYSTFKVNAMEQFGDGIYVYYSAEGTGAYKINAVVKYTLGTNNTIVETGIHGHSPTNHPSTYWGSTPVATDQLSDTYSFGRFHVTNSDKLFLLVPGNDTHLYEVTTTVTAVANVPTLSSGYSWADITSITTNSGSTYEFVVIGETTSANHKFHFYNTANGSWTGGTITYDYHLEHMSKMDFGENNGNHESIVVNLIKVGAGEQFIRYSEHNNFAIGITGFVELNTATFPLDTVVMQLRHAYKNPSGAKYLFVCTNDTAGSPLQHGRVFRVDTDKRVSTLTTNNPNTDKGWNPTCIDDVVTGTANNNQFFEHAKAYIVAYGVVYNTHTSSGNLPKGALNRMTDIGWASGSWAGNGTVDIGWTDLHSKYNFYEIAEDNSSTTPTIYHQTDKNPIVPTGDTVRFIPGAIGKVSNTEAKGLWLGYINRSMFNGDYTIPANWYGYVNTLNNPFKVTLKRKYKADTNLRNGDTVKYNCTAVYDGVQESLFDKNDELILDDNDIQKHIVELDVEIADITALNKRITGINFYRAIGNSGIYSNYQLIGHMTFVDSGNNLSSVGAIKDIQLQYSGNEVIYVKATNTSQRDGIRTRDYSENWLGTNKYAIDTDGGFDGIDDPSGSNAEYFDPFDGFLLYMSIGTIRPMTSSQLYVVATSNNVADSIPLSIEDEIVTTATTAVPSVPLSAPVDTGLDLTGSVTWATTDNPKTFYVDGDATNILKAGDKIQLGTHNAVITLTAVSDYDDVNTITQIVGNADINGSASGTPDVKLREVASGEHIIILSARGADEPNVSPTITTSAVAHNNGVSASKQREHNYTRLSLDENANFGNSYLDGDGNFNGSSWKIKRRRNANYTTTYNASSGAYGGNNIGVVFPIDYADFNNNITANSLSGSIVFFGEKSVQIEGNSSFDSDIGGVWVKTTESFGASNTSTISQQAQLLEGFSVSTAQGSTTPGMGFTKNGDKVTITCRDFRLEDLGETPTQTIYSNRVNGQYARELKGRLFLGNVVLNPEDKAEEHRDWIAYSELNEFDTIPVSNVIAFDDREGGDITGLAVLFGRLVIFKPQAIFILNVSDPANPNGWAVVESKHNIGNVAPQGVVEVHDSIYFVYHDGIYRVTSNMVASSTATPSVMDKVSDKIDDQFLLATDKTAIKGLYDPSRQEVIYKWMEGNTQRVWAYNYVRESWRKIDMGTGVLDILAYDETGVPLNYDKTSNKIIKFDTANASVAKWKSKRFPLDLHRKRLLRYGTVQFTGTDDLTYNIYLDGATSASFTKTISADGGINRFPIKRYAKKFEVEIATASSTNALTLERLQIEME